MSDLSLAPLGEGCVEVGEQRSVDDVCAAAFEDAVGFEAAVAVGAPSGDQGLRGRVPVRLSEGDAVDGGVELPVAGTAQSVAGSVRRPDRQGAVPL
jgi:hypothetical protein